MSKIDVVKLILTGDIKGLVKKFTGFKYQNKLGRLSASNNYLDLNTLQAYSYDWWCYFRVIDGIRVFNKGRYSITTNRHQSNMRGVLDSLGLYPEVYVNTRTTLEGWDLVSVERQLELELEQAIAELHACKRAKSMKRSRIEKRIDQINWYIDQVQEKTGQVVEVEIDGRVSSMRKREYAEWRLTASTGDFHMHKVV